MSGGITGAVLSLHIALAYNARSETPPPPSVSQKTSTTVVSKQTIEIKHSGQIYSVQPGDTLWDISKMYNGLTVEKLKKLNKLRSNKIVPGQKLIVG